MTTPPAFKAQPIPTLEAISSTFKPVELYPIEIFADNLVPLTVNIGILKDGLPLFLLMFNALYLIIAAAFGGGGKKSTIF